MKIQLYLEEKVCDYQKNISQKLAKSGGTKWGPDYQQKQLAMWAAADQKKQQEKFDEMCNKV